MPVSNNANAEGGNNTREAKVDELPIGTILAGKYKLTELVLSHPALGLTYHAINREGDGYVVKVDSEKNLLSLVRSEAGFLQAVLQINACDYFVQFMHGARYQRVIYFVTRFRAGPSLNQCLGAMPQGMFSVGTAVRVAYHISKAINVVHSLNYLLRRMDPNVIKFDVHTKSIYLSDLSSVRVDPIKIKLDAPVRWAGAQLYAPMQHHNGGSVGARHDIEALVFLLVDMTTAKLPWEGCPLDMMGSVKRQTITDQTLFAGCPSQYSVLHTYISCLTDDNIDYDQIWKKMEESWKQAGIKDLKSPFDWEPRMRAPDSHGY